MTMYFESNRLFLIFRQSYYRVEKGTEGIFYRNDKTLLWNLQPKNEVAATNDRDMQTKIHNRLKAMESVFSHLPATL